MAFKSSAARDRYFQEYDAALNECPTPDAVHDVVTEFGTTRLYRFGNGDAPPMVLIGGLASTAACWAPLIPAFAEHHPVYAVDTLGEPGRSVQATLFTSTEDRVRWLDGVFAELGLDSVHLVGGSTGGYYAVNQAIHAPDRLASVSLLDPTTVTVNFSAAVLWYGVPAVLLNRDWLWRRFLRWSAGADLDRPDVRVVLGGIREFKARLPPQLPPKPDALRTVKVPLLALFAGRSVVHDAAKATERARALLPHAEVELWPDVGHFMYLTPQDQVRISDRVLKFIAK